MRLIFGFYDGDWNSYLRGVAREQDCVVVPLSAQWQRNANALRVTAEAYIRARRQNQSISNTINFVQFLGDDAVAFYVNTVMDSANPAVATNQAEFTALGNNCFTNPVRVNMQSRFPSQIQGEIRNSVLTIWRQVRERANFSYQVASAPRLFSVQPSPPRQRP